MCASTDTPVVVTGSRAIPEGAQILRRSPIIFAPGIGTALVGDGKVEIVQPGPNGVDLADVVKHLGSEGMLSVLIEGGPTVAASALRAGIVDQIVFYIAGKLAIGIGLPAISGTFETIDDAVGVTIAKVTKVGPDIRVDAILEKET